MKSSAISASAPRAARGDRVAELVDQREHREEDGDGTAEVRPLGEHHEEHEDQEARAHVHREAEELEDGGDCDGHVGSLRCRPPADRGTAPVDLHLVSYVYAFDHKHRRPPMEYKDLLGGKGANLAEMTSVLKLPVPPGFTISTDACRAYMKGGWPAGARRRDRHSRSFALEKKMGRKLGDPFDPLLVACAPAPSSRCRA